jgi:hypothetical protein
VVVNARLFSPSNVDLGAFNANGTMPVNLSETGTYAVRIVVNTLVHTGAYSLGLACH